MVNEAEKIVRSQLSGSERLLWFGQPRQGIFFRLTDIFAIFFLLIWISLAAIWEIAAIQGNQPLFIQLMVIPFAFFGLFLVLNNFFTDVWRRKKTYYGVTNERIIIISGLFNRKTKSFGLRTLSDVIIEEK